MTAVVKRMDKQTLYEQSVQNASAEVSFMKRVYTKIRSVPARILREDFCGSAAVCAEWVRSGKDRLAYGVDLHGPTLKWGQKHNIEPLGDLAERVQLIQGNVLDRHPFKADIVAALNFSYFIFKTRELMLQYIRSVLRSLAPEGILVLDIFGGPDAMVVQEEETDHGDFVYVWDQASYNPVSGEIRCHIHFKIPGWKTMRRAYTYDWRLWGLPELVDLLKEGGFRQVDVYWEGTNQKEGDGNGVFRRSTRGDDSSSWVSYIVAVK